MNIATKMIRNRLSSSTEDGDMNTPERYREQQEVDNELSRQRREREEGADAPLRCPDCDEVTGDGERCSECLSERASYYVEGGQG